MKTIIVTGGAHGIGKAITLKAVAEKMQVIVLDINATRLEQLRNELNCPNLYTHVCDVSNAEETASIIKSIGVQCGHIDYIVNNAGISKFTPIDELSFEQWDKILKINLSSMFYVIKSAKQFFPLQGGSIVNIASTRALMSEPHSEAYASTKGGIVALTHALSVSLAGQARVNCISPGWIEINDYESLSESDHNQHPAGRVGLPNDIAETTMFLLSDKANFITGQNIIVDGGMTKKMIYE